MRGVCERDLKLDLLATQRRRGGQGRDLVERARELLRGFNQRRALQRPLSRFAPPFDRGFGQARLREVMRQQLRLGRSGGGELSRNVSATRRCKTWRRLLSKFS